MHFSKCATLFYLCRIFQNATFLCRIFPNAPNFSICVAFYKKSCIFPNAPHVSTSGTFSICASFFQMRDIFHLCRIFPKPPHFFISDAFFKCATFFYWWCLFPNSSQFSQCATFFRLRHISANAPHFFKYVALLTMCRIFSKTPHFADAPHLSNYVSFF